MILKDLYNIKSYIRYYSIVMIFMLVWGILMKNISMVTIYLVIMGGMLLFTGISLDETVHFEKLLFTMPISPGQYVSSKYVLLLILTGGGTVIGFSVHLIQGLAAGSNLLEVMMEAISICVMAPVFWITYAITLPILFKRGVEKARYIYILVMLAVGAGIFAVFPLLEKSGIDIEAMELKGNPLLVLAVGLIVFCAAAIWVSYRLSLKFIQKREW